MVGYELWLMNYQIKPLGTILHCFMYLFCGHFLNAVSYWSNWWLGIFSRATGQTLMTGFWTSELPITETTSWPAVPHVVRHAPLKSDTVPSQHWWQCIKIPVALCCGRTARVTQAAVTWSLASSFWPRLVLLIPLGGANHTEPDHLSLFRWDCSPHRFIHPSSDQVKVVFKIIFL